MEVISGTAQNGDLDSRTIFQPKPLETCSGNMSSLCYPKYVIIKLP